MRSQTNTLASAMLTLARDIQCEDGVATAAITEAATRLLEQADEIASLRLAIRRLAEQDSTLTAEEREAIAFMLRHAAHAAAIPSHPDSGDYILHHDALRGLLERLGANSVAQRKEGER